LPNRWGGGDSASLHIESDRYLTIGYFADGPWAHKAFDKLLSYDKVCIAFVCARHDTPDQILKTKASLNGIDFITHPKINSDDFHDIVSHYRCDLFVSMSFNQIFKKRIINYPVFGTINCHAGKLPFYRGRNILNWALINDEKEFGITVHYMDEGIDTGDIILQESYPIGEHDDYATLLERAYDGCAELLFNAIKQIQAGTAKRIPQYFIHPIGTYCSARIEGDERLDWNQNSRDIFNFVRAISKPGPQARTFLNNVELMINKVRWLPQAPIYKGIPGAVIQKNEEGFIVKTKDSYVLVIEWTGDTKIKVGDRLV